MSAQTNQVTEKASHYSILDLSTDISTSDGFRYIMDDVIAHIRANVASASDGDPEGIHQLRIGIRRARSALRMFKIVIPKTETVVAQFDRRMRRYANIFGKARDWDVFVTKTLNHFPDADKVRAQAEPFRAKAHDDVKFALVKDFTPLLDRISTWAKNIELKRSQMKKAAPILLDQLAKRVKSRRQTADIKDENALHRLRRAAKQLRYSIEHVHSFYDNKKATTYHHNIKEALDLLGDLNDAVVTKALVDQLKIVDKRSKKWLDRQHRRALKKVPTALHNLRMKAYW